jgi:hypothetical protein
MAYFGRGSIPYAELMEMTPFEKDLVNEFQTEHIKNELKKPNPIY